MMNKFFKIVWTTAWLLMATASFTVSGTTFTDVEKDDWFAGNVQILVDKDIIRGYGDGRFAPDKSMTVDAFIKTMVVALGENPGNGDSYWAQPYIDRAMALGIVKEGDFKAYNAMITREDMAKLSVRTAEALEGKKSYKYDGQTNDLLIKQITDRGDTTEQAQGFISKAYELGLITGYPDGSFKPKAGLKRSEACTVIRRVIEAGQRKPFVEPKADEWAVRAEKIYEETGIRPFDNAVTDLGDGVISDDKLKNVPDIYAFKSGVIYRSDDPDRDDISITYGLVFAKENAENMKTQLFEIEYILSKIHKIDNEIVKEVVESLKHRTQDIFVGNEYWYPNGGGRVRIAQSYPTGKTASVSVIGRDF